MISIIKGVVVCLITICLFGLSMKVKAGTPDEFLSIFADKRVVYKGTCWFTKTGVLTFKMEDKKKVELCVVGFEIGNEKKHYVAIYDEKDQLASKVIVYDEATKTQEVLWLRGTGV